VQVSVIIPVRNAEKYVYEAVESALAQPETGEVILIEDASLDNSLQACKELAQKFEKVRLLQHEDRKNHGAGASRNLGIRNAKFEFIAFLDADDFFLPNRFSVPMQIFEVDPRAEGVYEAVGTYFENEEARQRWGRRKTLTTMMERVQPENFFELQDPIGSFGYCPTGGWVVKRSVFEKTGLFDEHLRLHQDTVMNAKLAAVGRMVAGRLEEPVSMRRVHDHNRILAPRSAIEVYRNRILMWVTLWKWAQANLSKTRQQILLKRFLDFVSQPHKIPKSRFINRLQSLRQLIALALEYPELFKEFLFWRKCFLNFVPSVLVRIKNMRSLKVKIL